MMYIENMNDICTNGFGIRAVSRLTGLSPHLLRAWERRYGIVTPHRTASGRRIYSSDDVERLRQVKAALDAGFSIGEVARTAPHALGRFLEAGRGQDQADEPPMKAEGDAGSRAFLERVVAAVRIFDERELKLAMSQALIMLGPGPFARDFAVPLLHTLGQRWRSGEFHAAQEHLASELLHYHLMRALLSATYDDDAPVAVAGTLRRQRHQLGALVAAVVAASLGWRVRFLGADLPPEEIAWAAGATAARAVLLSIVYPPDDPDMAGELHTLAQALSPGVAIVVGGRHASAYADVLAQLGMLHVPELDRLGDVLDALRRSVPADRAG